MNKQEIIHKAVELADGWEFTSADEVSIPEPPDFGCIYTQYALDALAAQLVRQVNSLDGFCVSVGNEVMPNRAVIYGPKFKRWRGYVVADVEGLNVTMNTIKAIVESGVLENNNV